MSHRAFFAVVVLVAILLATVNVDAKKMPKVENPMVELTPQTLNSFLNTHKPVFIMFYAPWCGHCKALHPDWAKLAKSTKDVVRIGAIDADKYRDIGGKFGIQGFPTIKYWKMGNKKGVSPSDYQGARSHKALHNAALAEIKHNVVTIKNMADVEKHLAKAESGKAIILATSKNKSPPIFSVLSYSPHFKKVSFLLVSEKNQDVATKLGVEKFPTVMVINKKEGEEEELEKEIYDGKIEYTGIAKWLQALLGGGSGDAAAEESGSADEKPKPKKNSSPAAPLEPTELTPENFKTFCSAGATKVNGQQPFCVIALGDHTEDLKNYHSKYGRDAVLFFYTKASKALRVADDLTRALNPMSPIDGDDIVVLRAAKNKSKFVVWKKSDGRTFDSFMDLVVEGATTFERAQGFPELTKE